MDTNEKKSSANETVRELATVSEGICDQCGGPEGLCSCFNRF